MPTFSYRVRAGQRLPHNGEVLEAGAPVQLTRAVAAEVRHLVEALDADGQVIDPPTPLQVELEERPVHEREGILRRRREELAQRLADLQDVAARTAATAADAAADVARTQADVAAIDAQLAAPVATPAPAVAPPEKPRVRVTTLAAPESTSLPAIPAQKE